LAVAQPPEAVPAPQHLTPPPVPTSTPVVHSTVPHETGSAPSTTPTTTGASESHFFSGNNCVDESPSSDGPFFFGEYLLLRAHRQAHDFAIVDPVLNRAIDGNLSSAQWETASGYRFGAGWKLYGDWEAAAIYTYFHTKDDRAWNVPPGGTLFATRSNPFVDSVTRASVASNLDYDVIDLEIAKNIDTVDRLDLRLSAGVRYAEITQKFLASYAGGTVPGAGPLNVTSPVFFDGFGARVGAEGHWKLFGGLSLYGKAAGTLMSGEFRTTLRETFNNGATSINLADKYQSVVPIAEVGLGVAYTTEHFRFRIGYELTNWFNMVDGLDMVNGQGLGKFQRKMSDLSLEGLAVQAGFIY